MTKLSSSTFFSQMAPSMFLVFILAIAGGSDAAWCVCKPDASSGNLQKAIDYACGAGADCNPIHQNGPCYNPNTALAHCSYAANSYYQRNGQNQQACDFSGTAQLSPSDPSQPGCPFPATSSAAGSSSTTPSTTPATPGTPTVTPATPGTPTVTPATPATPTVTPATPATPTVTPVTPATPTVTPTTPGTPTMTPASPGSSGTTPIGGDGTTFNPNTPTTTGGSSSFGMGPSTVGFDGSHASTNFHSNPVVFLILVSTLAICNF